MNANETVGAVLVAVMALASAFYFFHDKAVKKIKEENEYREKQLQATLETNHQLKMMNDQISRIGKSDERQNAVLEVHKEDIDCLKKENRQHESRIEKIEKTVFKKDRV